MSLSKKKIAGVSASDAEAVINFLNSATSAEEIAARIEIPAERDVGLNVARNLLEERAKLGNKFTNIEQVIRVQSIGPERLAEIIASLKKEIELKVISDIPPLIARNHNGFLAPGSPLCYTYPTPNRDNNEGEKKGGYSGFIIMQFASSVRSLEGDDIVEVARQACQEIT